MNASRSEAEAGGVALVAAAAALWGTDGLFRRGLSLALPAARVVYWEHLILTVVMFPLLLRALRDAARLSRCDRLGLLVIGCGASALATVLFTAAFAYGDPTTPLLLQKLQPLIAMGAAHLLLGERYRGRFGAFLLPAMAGAFLITFPDPAEVRLEELVPALLAVGAAALWALGTVLGRRLATQIDFARLTALRFGIGLLAMVVLLPVVEGPDALAAPSPRDLASLALLALVPGLLALLLYYRGLRRTLAGAATLAELAFPLSAIVVNYIAFGATLTATQWVGLCVLSATIVTLGLAGRRGSEAIGISIRPEFATQ